MSIAPVTVTVTGASGQIAYGMLFRIAAGRCSALTSRSNFDCSRFLPPCPLPKALRWNSKTAHFRC